MYYEETGRLSLFYKIVIWFLIFFGFFAGIGFGIILKEPSQRALEAMEEIADDPIGSITNYELKEAAEETEWTALGFLAMLSVWITSAIEVLFFYTTKCHMEMMDDTVGILKKIEEQTKTE